MQDEATSERAEVSVISVEVAVLPARQPRAASGARWEHVALLGVLLLTTFLDFVNLARIGYGNTYYAAAVKSMLQGWHNFFFVTFDPGGFVTVDKPPFGLWIQTLAAKLFGFTGLSLIVPQALAGVLSVLVLYCLVRRVFGGAAGLLAALALALSPISVVANRDNIFDSLLVLLVLLAALAAVQAAEGTHLRLLLASAVLVGIGFNTKMLEAYLVVPALVLLYLLGAPRPWRVRAAHLGLFLGTLLVVSLSWAVVVDLTPATDRPYVGSSTTNSELELAFAYNGLQRLVGVQPAPQPHNTRAVSAPTMSSGAHLVTLHPVAPIHPFNAKGTVGPLRLLQYELGGQIGWLLPLALFGLLSSSSALRPHALLRSWRRRRLSRRQGAALLWGVELLTMGVFFSWSAFFNVYYLAMLAPPVAALFGIGLVGLWRDYRGTGWRGWLLPAALAATGAEQIYLLRSYPFWLPTLWPLVAVGTLGAALLLTALRTPLLRPESAPAPAGAATGARVGRSDPTAVAPSRRRPIAPQPQTLLLAMGVTAVLLAPTLWTLTSLRSANEGNFPLAGPTRVGDAVQAAPTADPLLIRFLETHESAAGFLAATVSTDAATPLIFDTSDPVMALGGYTGADPILTPADLPDLVSDRTVRYFLLPSSNLSNAQMRAFYPWATRTVPHRTTNELTQWVAGSCAPVTPRYWKTWDFEIGPLQLWDCGAL